MVKVTIDTEIEGQLKRNVDERGRVYISEWKNREVFVLLLPKYSQLSNQELMSETREYSSKKRKDAILEEIERELGWEPEKIGYNISDGTIEKITLARIVMGIRRLKSKLD